MQQIRQFFLEEQGLEGLSGSGTDGQLGGSLGWKTRGALLPDFEKVAFELEPSTTGNPKWQEVKTSEGYHIIMVEGRK